MHSARIIRHGRLPAVNERCLYYYNFTIIIINENGIQ